MKLLKSCLRRTTLLSTAILLATGSAYAGSGTITYDIQHVSSFGVSGTFSSPEQITADLNGNIYIADRGNNQIQVFNRQGTHLSQFGSGQLNNPIGVAIGSDGRIIVSDAYNNRIQFFNSTTYANEGGFDNVSNGSFNIPHYINTDAAGNIYVAEWGGARTIIFNSVGDYISDFPTNGNGISVAVSPDNKIYVSSNGAINVYSSSNIFLGQFGVGQGSIDNPSGISIDAQGNIYITSSDRIRVFNKDGDFILDYSNSTAPSGPFSNLHGIYADAEGYIYVTDRGGNQAHVIQLTSTETFATAPAGNQIAVTPLSNVVLDGSGGIFSDNFIGYHHIDINSGDWTLSGTNSISGIVKVNDGTLTNDGVITTDFGNQVFGSGVLTNSGTFSGAIFNHGNVDNTGTINGTVYNYGTYFGTGTVATIANAGNIIVSSPTDVMHITNDYDDAGGVYNVSVDASGQTSKILAGSANLSTGSVVVNAANGIYHVNTSYVILSTTGGVTGTFASVSDNLAFLDSTLDYSNPNEVVLTLTRNDGINPFPTGMDFAPFALDAAQQSTAAALSAFSASQFGGDTAVFNTVLAMSTSEVSEFLSQIAPDEIAVLPQIQRSMVQSMQTPLFQRLQTVSNRSRSSYALFSPAESGGLQPDQVWIQNIGSVSNQDSTSNGAAGYRLGVIGTRVGADKELSPQTTLGISAAYAHGTANYKTSNDKSETQYGHIDLYGRHVVKETDVVLEGFIGAGGGRMDSSRFITAGGLGLIAQGNTNIYDVSTSLRASKPVAVTEHDIITPSLTASANWTRQNSFTESGASPFNLNLATSTATPVTITPMVNWQRTIKNVKHGFNLTPDLGIGATWQLNELDNPARAGFANGTNIPGFTVNGTKQAPLSLNVGASLTMQPFTENKYVPQLQVQATTQFNRKSSNATGTLSAKWDW